jgi:hypothetical protein
MLERAWMAWRRTALSLDFVDGGVRPSSVFSTWRVNGTKCKRHPTSPRHTATAAINRQALLPNVPEAAKAC